jgi:hypothetical protein
MRSRKVRFGATPKPARQTGALPLRDFGLGVGPITPVTVAAAAFAAALKKDGDSALAPEAGCRLGSLSKWFPTL